MKSEEKEKKKQSTQEKKNVKKKTTRSVTDVLGVALFSGLSRFGKFAANENNKNKLIIFSKITIAILTSIFMCLVSTALAEIGSTLIEMCFNSMETVILTVWNFSIYYLLVLLIIMLFDRLLRNIKNSEEYDELYAPSSKKNKSKIALMKALRTFTKVMMRIALLPITAIAVCLLVFFNLLIYVYISTGLYLIGSFVAVLGLFLLSVAICRYFYKRCLHNGGVSVQKTGVFVTISIVIFLVGMLSMEIETINYVESNYLPCDYVMNQTEFFVTKDKDSIINISNDYTDINMELKTDDSLDGEVKVVVSSNDFSKIRYSQVFDSNGKVYVDVSSRVNFDSSSIYEIFKLVLTIVKDETMYNYSLVEYPSITVYANSKDIKEIEFYNGKKSYLPQGE